MSTTYTATVTSNPPAGVLSGQFYNISNVSSNGTRWDTGTNNTFQLASLYTYASPIDMSFAGRYNNVVNSSYKTYIGIEDSTGNFSIRTGYFTGTNGNSVEINNNGSISYTTGTLATRITLDASGNYVVYNGASVLVSGSFSSYGSAGLWRINFTTTGSAGANNNITSLSITYPSLATGTLVKYLLVGGGGAGSVSAGSSSGAGGGSSGCVSYITSQYLQAGTYAVTVGTGGTTTSGLGNVGGDSSFITSYYAIYAKGGNAGLTNGSNAAAGGNTGYANNSGLTTYTGGTVNGNYGGSGASANANGNSGSPPNGPNGLSNSITGSAVTYAGGGGGGGQFGGHGSDGTGTIGRGGYGTSYTGSAEAGQNGIVIISYPTGTFTYSYSGSSTTGTDGSGNTWISMTTSGNLVLTATASANGNFLPFM